jgi:hypothetical protein
VIDHTDVQQRTVAERFRVEFGELSEHHRVSDDVGQIGNARGNRCESPHVRRVERTRGSFELRFRDRHAITSP